MSRRFFVPLAALIALSSVVGACATRSAAPALSSNEDDDAFCRANGVAVGSNDYAACRKNRDVQRSNAAARSDRSQRNLAEMMLNNRERP